MTDKSNIGLTLYGVAGLPATNNTAGFEALTFVQLKGIQTIPVFGITHSNIDVPDTATGLTGGVKGAAIGKDVAMTYRGDGTDTGIATAIVAAGVRPGSYRSRSSTAQAQTQAMVRYQWRAMLCNTLRDTFTHTKKTLKTTPLSKAVQSTSSRTQSQLTTYSLANPVRDGAARFGSPAAPL